MARKKREEEHENLERWLVSYADFITLLFAFFVVLYAMSSVNEGKYKILSESLISAFQVQPRSLKPIEVGDIQLIRDTNIVSQNRTTASETSARNDPLRNDRYEENLKEMADEIQQAMSGLIQKKHIDVRRDQNWLEVEINTSILFESGSAKLMPAAVSVLTRIARILRRFPNPINVEGFTDSLPINTVEFPSNWELSAGRAASVVHLFTREGVSPKRMAAIGYGQYRPVAGNDTAAGRSKNRRVVLAISAHDSAERQRVGEQTLNVPPASPGEAAGGRLFPGNQGPAVRNQTIDGGAGGNILRQGLSVPQLNSGR